MPSGSPTPGPGVTPQDSGLVPSSAKPDANSRASVRPGALGQYTGAPPPWCGRTASRSWSRPTCVGALLLASLHLPSLTSPVVDGKPSEPGARGSVHRGGVTHLLIAPARGEKTQLRGTSRR